jgi:hypothetical protein
MSIKIRKPSLALNLSKWMLPQWMFPLLAAPAPGLSLQQHRLPPPPGVGCGGGVSGSGERGMRLVWGMRASDICGVGGAAATPVPGPSPQRHQLSLLAAPPPGIGGDAGVGNIYQQKSMLDI